MINNEIVEQLKTIPEITDIFWTDIFFGSAIKMRPWPFLQVSKLTSNPTQWRTEVGHTQEVEPFQFMIVGEDKTTERQMYLWNEVILNAMGEACNRLEFFDDKRVWKFRPTTRSPIVYNQERPSLSQDFIFTT